MYGLNNIVPVEVINGEDLVDKSTIGIDEGLNWAKRV